MSNTASFTCLNCSVRFQNAEMQREHYKTDWHRYNLKRKIAELPPVSIEEFEKRINQQKSADAAALEDQSLYCKACKKLFKSKNAHDNHLDSRKHKDNLKGFLEQNGGASEEDVSEKSTRPKKEFVVVDGEAMDEDEEDEDDDWEEEWDNPIENNDCLFCPNHSEDLISNIKHMSVKHSFFIPDAEYCVDVEGLLGYLAEKICRDFICIWCNEKGRTFYSLDAVRNHMVEKGHCKMLHEGAALAEYVDFYDYSASYPDHVSWGNVVRVQVAMPRWTKSL